MDHQLWALFLETGEPCAYLLCRAGEKQAEKNTEKAKPQKEQQETPPASL